MAQSLTIHYDLHLPTPPSTSPYPNLPPKKSQEFLVNTNLKGKKYYESLRVSIGEAKATLGAELTAWRDAVELLEESKKGGEEEEEAAEE